MNARVPVVPVILAALAVPLVVPASADHRQVPVMRIHAETEVMAKPGAVWSWLTTGRNLVTWCPQWKSPKNATVQIVRVGDVLDYSDEWGGKGRSIVTYLDKGHELRVAHEPSKGDYMCQAKFVLTPLEKGTRVELWDQYTDESPAADVAATAEKMEKELAETLAALKKGCETHRSRLPSLHVTR